MSKARGHPSIEMRTSLQRSDLYMISDPIETLGEAYTSCRRVFCGVIHWHDASQLPHTKEQRLGHRIDCKGNVNLFILLR
jgi:hypothetical protein